MSSNTNLEPRSVPCAAEGVPHSQFAKISTAPCDNRYCKGAIKPETKELDELLIAEGEGFVQLMVHDVPVYWNTFCLNHSIFIRP